LPHLGKMDADKDRLGVANSALGSAEARTGSIGSGHRLLNRSVADRRTPEYTLLTLECARAEIMIESRKTTTRPAADQSETDHPAFGTMESRQDVSLFWFVRHAIQCSAQERGARHDFPARMPKRAGDMRASV